MCKWLEDAIDFWFPVEVDMDIGLDIPETLPDSASHLEEPDNPVDIPPMFQRDKEAEATAKKADVYVRFMAKP